MARLTKTDAARQLGIARSTFYKLIDQGKISPTPDGMIDQAELVRVAAYADTLKGRPRTSSDIIETPIQKQDEISYGRPQTDVSGRSRTDRDERPQTSSDVLVDILREQLQVLREELQEARQSAQAAREREALLLQMLQDMQHRYDRLLMPRAPLPPSPQDTSGATQSRTRPPEIPLQPRDHPRGSQRPWEGIREATMRRRIVALLQEHPEGLTLAEMRTLLGVDKSLADTCLGMLRYGLV